jgi:type IV pilus assembly protein PilA
MRRQKGFTLLELILVVAVILIIAAIAIPSYRRARMAANETSAVASMHSINIAQISYATSYPVQGFAADLNTLGPGPVPGNTSANSTNALLLDNVLGCTAGVGTTPCPKSGYNFSITIGSGSPASTYDSNANPIVWSDTGTRYFYSDNSEVIRYNITAIADVSDPAVQ